MKVILDIPDRYVQQFLEEVKMTAERISIDIELGEKK